MPPKRKRRGSPSLKGLAPGERLKRSKLSESATPQWSWIGTEVEDVADITSEHRLLACGLSSQNLHPLCPNKYSHEKKPNNLSSVDANVDAPEDDIIIVTDEHLPCDPKLCKSNPNCLNYLGQDLWESEEKALNTFMKSFDFGHNPSEDERKPGIPVGLKNLGATCYANVFLQVWFRDLAFRRGVYNCKPPTDSLDSPIFQLQATFAALQDSNAKSYNPIKLIESLQIRSEEQQDAQEFSKLFITHLNSEFQKQNDPMLRKLITGQFQGTQVYVTTCQKCGFRSESKSTFFELELNLKNACKLEDQIQTYLQPELLTDGNQYLCSHCKCLRDATRGIEVQALPPVLNFSLLRFVFDASSLGRKKLKHAIKFPSSIDMSPFVFTPPSDVGNRIYELRGVLLHKGPSAYHGHYEVQVFDAESHEWFQFNDEQVARISGPGEKSKSKKSPEDPDAESKSATRGQSEHRIDSKDGIAISRDAYMLVYMRKEFSEFIKEKLAPPSQALALVNSNNDLLHRSKELYTQRENFAANWLRTLREHIRTIYTTWNLNSVHQDSILASRLTLKKWMSEVPQNFTLRHVHESGHPLAFELKDTWYSADDITCPHGLIDPLKSANIKRIDKAVYHGIMEGYGCRLKPVFTTADLCHQCVELQFREHNYMRQHPQITSQFISLSEPEEGSTGYWTSRSWLKDWKLVHPRMHIVGQGDPPPDSDGFASDVVCEHGNITLNSTSRMVISEQAKDLLQSIYPNWSPPSTECELCAICEAAEVEMRESRRHAKRGASEEKVALKALYQESQPSLKNERCYSLVDIRFVKAWRDWIDYSTEAKRPERVDNGPLLCAHNLTAVDMSMSVDLSSTALVVEREDWDALVKFYQSGPAIQLKVYRDVQNSFTLELDPPLCSDCSQRRAVNWTSTTIAVRMVADVGDDQTFLGLSTYKSTGRQPRRLRRTCGIGATLRFDVEKTTTVCDVMIRIQQAWKIPAICQKLAYDRKIAVDGGMTMTELGVHANGIIKLMRLDEAYSIDDGIEDDQSGSREEGRAFVGTLLSSSQLTPDDSNARADPNMKENRCSACTFMNNKEAMACIVCDTLFIEE